MKVQTEFQSYCMASAVHRSKLYLLARRIVVIYAFINLPSCAHYNTDLEPTMTTYPREPHTVQVVSQIAAIEYGGNIRVWDNAIETKYQGTDAFSYDTYVIKNGDDATTEVFIHDPKKTNASREHLNKLAEKRGFEICRGKYAILETTYFYGDEATPSFYGLSNVKSMRVDFRCPLEFTSSSISQNKDLFDLSEELVWPGFFDVLAIDSSKNAEKLFDDVKLTASQRGMKQLRAGKIASGGYFYLGSGDMGNRSVHQRVEQLAAIIEPTDQGSRVRIILPSLRFQNIRTSVSTIRKIPNENGELVPWQRNVAYDRARYFLSILESLTKT